MQEKILLWKAWLLLFCPLFSIKHCLLPLVCECIPSPMLLIF